MSHQTTQVMLDLAFTKFLLTLSRNLSGLFLYCNYRTNCNLIFHLRLTLLKNGENLNIICKLAFEHRTLTSYPVREVYRCVKVLWKNSLPSSSIQSLDEPLVKIMKLFFHITELSHSFAILVNISFILSPSAKYLNLCSPFHFYYHL